MLPKRHSTFAHSDSCTLQMIHGSMHVTRLTVDVLGNESMVKEWKCRRLRCGFRRTPELSPSRMRQIQEFHALDVATDAFDERLLMAVYKSLRFALPFHQVPIPQLRYRIIAVTRLLSSTFYFIPVCGVRERERQGPSLRSLSD